MRTKYLILYIAAILLGQVAMAQKTKKALFVIVDGIANDVIEKLNTPNLDAIAKVGGYTRAHVGGEKKTDTLKRPQFLRLATTVCSRVPG